MVYHGGIGTLAQALTAGSPHLVMPLSHDQPDNARILERLGIGATLLPKNYTATAVVEKLNHLLGETAVRFRCQELAGHVDFDASLAQASDVIEQVRRTA